ncbi:MAG: hypothetical protein ACWGO1_13110, partial [Anaerolineales bacterium]
MFSARLQFLKRILFLVITAVAAVMLAAGLLVLVRGAAQHVRAASEVPQAPIPPPEGYPKFTRSRMLVSPGLVDTDGEVLHYRIEIVNTGAYHADGVMLVNPLPVNTTYNGDASSDALTPPVVSANQLTWIGDVGFDARVVISYSVTVQAGFSGVINNTAVIDHPQIPQSVSVSAEAIVTKDPLFTIRKSALPELPGANKPLVYTLELTNIGQPANGLNVVVTDVVPQHTSFLEAGQGGQIAGSSVTWQQPITLETGASSVFTFSVDISPVPSGTVINNDSYQV